MPIVAAVAVALAWWKKLPLYYWMSYPMPEGQIALARERGLSGGLMKFLYPWISGRVGRFLLRRWVLPRAAHVFVQSPRMQQDLERLGIGRQKTTAVLMGVDLQALCSLSPEGVNDVRLKGRRVIGYLGTVDRPRSIEKLFEMLAIVQRSVPNALLLIVGGTEDGVHQRWLQARAAQAGVADAVLWTGWLPTAQGWAWMRHAEVALSAFPRGELLDSASPTKVPEYMALGVPVVCNDNPDQERAVRESGAGLCVPYTPDDFAQAVETILALAPEQRARMIEAGRQYVAEHRDYARIAASVAQTYRRLAQGGLS